MGDGSAGLLSPEQSYEALSFCEDYLSATPLVGVAAETAERKEWETFKKCS